MQGLDFGEGCQVPKEARAQAGKRVTRHRRQSQGSKAMKGAGTGSWRKARTHLLILFFRAPTLQTSSGVQKKLQIARALCLVFFCGYLDWKGSTLGHLLWIEFPTLGLGELLSSNPRGRWLRTDAERGRKGSPGGGWSERRGKMMERRRAPDAQLDLQPHTASHWTLSLRQK